MIVLNNCLPVRLSLKQISAIIEPGKFTAVLGPSGSGKSSLLQLICGYLKISQGNISYIHNRKSYDSLTKFHDKTGFRIRYVGSNPIGFPELSIGNLLKYKSKITKFDNVEEVKKVLNLRRVEHQQLSTLLQQPRASAGEKKLTSLACALCEPYLLGLVLDEPTTSMDITSAINMVIYLRELIATKQIAFVVAVLHQPSPSMWQFFDNLLLISHGYVIYSGPRDLAIPTLSRISTNLQMADDVFCYISPIDQDEAKCMSQRFYKSNVGLELMRKIENPGNYETLKLVHKQISDSATAVYKTPPPKTCYSRFSKVLRQSIWITVILTRCIWSSPVIYAVLPMLCIFQGLGLGLMFRGSFSLHLPAVTNIELVDSTLNSSYTAMTHWFAQENHQSPLNRLLLHGAAGNITSNPDPISAIATMPEAYSFTHRLLTCAREFYSLGSSTADRPIPYPNAWFMKHRRDPLWKNNPANISTTIKTPPPPYVVEPPSLDYIPFDSQIPWDDNWHFFTPRASLTVTLHAMQLYHYIVNERGPKIAASVSNCQKKSFFMRDLCFISSKVFNEFQGFTDCLGIPTVGSSSKTSKRPIEAAEAIRKAEPIQGARTEALLGARIDPLLGARTEPIREAEPLLGARIEPRLGARIDPTRGAESSKRMLNLAVDENWPLFQWLRTWTKVLGIEEVYFNLVSLMKTVIDSLSMTISLFFVTCGISFTTLDSIYYFNALRGPMNE